ncbi:MAG TPA: hypothetical protein VMW82_01685 [Candidatus Paceibacterota bacterium]|nr:hypothetical protein [Candidatus Paceibacterota bacterium]
MGRTKTPLLIIIVVVIILVVAALVLMLNGQPKISDNKIKNLDIAKEIYGFLGEIKEIKDKTLTLAAIIPLADLTQEPIKAIIKVATDDQTKITKLIFPTEIKDNTEQIYPEEVSLQSSDLKVGDNINISSKVNIYDSLKNGTEFIVTDIFIVGN